MYSSKTRDWPISISSNSVLRHLHSLVFHFARYSKTNKKQTLLKQILDRSPNLSHLVVHWEDFRECETTYLNIKHIHLVLWQTFPEPKQHFDVCELSQLVPNLCRLETSNPNIMFTDNLIEFILEIIRRFNQMSYLIFNKYSRYPPKNRNKRLFKRTLLAQGHGQQLFDADNIRIRFTSTDKIYISL